MVEKVAGKLREGVEQTRYIATAVTKNTPMARVKIPLLYLWSILVEHFISTPDAIVPERYSPTTSNASVLSSASVIISIVVLNFITLLRLYITSQSLSSPNI